MRDVDWECGKARSPLSFGVSHAVRLREYIIAVEKADAAFRSGTST